MFMKLDNIQSKLLRWIQRATSDDMARPALAGVRIDDNMVACDGYRMHVMRTEDVMPELDPLYQHSTVMFGKVKAGENILEPLIGTEAYPDYEAILPRGEPEFEICANPKFIIDVLQGLDKNEHVRIVFYGDTSPFEIHGQLEGRPVYGLVMPMNMQEAPTRNWRPGREYSDD